MKSGWQRTQQKKEQRTGMSVCVCVCVSLCINTNYTFTGTERHTRALTWMLGFRSVTHCSRRPFRFGVGDYGKTSFLRLCPISCCFSPAHTERGESRRSIPFFHFPSASKQPSKTPRTRQRDSFLSCQACFVPQRTPMEPDLRALRMHTHTHTHKRTDGNHIQRVQHPFSIPVSLPRALCITFFLCHSTEGNRYFPDLPGKRRTGDSRSLIELHRVATCIAALAYEMQRNNTTHTTENEFHSPFLFVFVNNAIFYNTHTHTHFPGNVKRMQIQHIWSPFTYSSAINNQNGSFAVSKLNVSAVKFLIHDQNFSDTQAVEGPTHTHSHIHTLNNKRMAQHHSFQTQSSNSPYQLEANFGVSVFAIPTLTVFSLPKPQQTTLD